MPRSISSSTSSRSRFASTKKSSKTTCTAKADISRQAEQAESSVIAADRDLACGGRYRERIEIGSFFRGHFDVGLESSGKVESQNVAMRNARTRDVLKSHPNRRRSNRDLGGIFGRSF